VIPIRDERVVKQNKSHNSGVNDPERGCLIESSKVVWIP